MKLSDLTTPYAKCRIITYGRDYSTAVEKRIELQQISGYLYRGASENDSVGQPYCRFYLYYKELGIGMDIGRSCYPDEYTVEEVTAELPPKYLNGPQALIDSLDAAVANEQGVFNREIALARYLAPEKVDTYMAARQRYLDKQDAENAARRARQEAEDAAYCAEQNAKTHQQLDAAINTMRTGGILENDTISIYRRCYDCRSYSIINYLARQFGVQIPLKVQGWINKKLVRVVIQNGAVARVYYCGGPSRTFHAWMNELIAAVLRHTQKEENDEE